MTVARKVSLIGLAMAIAVLVNTANVGATVPVPATMTVDGIVQGEPYQWMNCDGATAIGVVDGMAFLSLQPEADEPSVRRLVAISASRNAGGDEDGTSGLAGTIVRERALPIAKEMVFRLVRRAAGRSVILAVSKNTVTAFRCSDFAQLWSTVTYLNVNLMTTVAAGKYFCFRYSQVSDASMGGPNQPICYRTRDGKLHWVGPAGVGAPTNVESAYRLSESGALVVVNTTSTIVFNMSNGKPFLTITSPAVEPSPRYNDGFRRQAWSNTYAPQRYRKGYSPQPYGGTSKSNGFLYGDTLLLCVEAKLAGYSMVTGELLWSFDDFASCRLYGSGGWFAGGRTVFLAATTSSIAGYRLEDGGLLWSKPNPLPKTSPPNIPITYAYLLHVAEDDSVFTILDIATPSTWMKPAPRYAQGNPLTGIMDVSPLLLPVFPTSSILKGNANSDDEPESSGMLLSGTTLPVTAAGNSYPYSQRVPEGPGLSCVAWI